MPISLLFDDKNILIDDETWRDLVTGNSALALGNVVETVRGALQRGGAFRIDGSSGIQRSFDQPTEFEKYFDEIVELRNELGLETLKY